ncbi:MAG: iron-containing alcohol dehydrogenase [Clostridium sp.]|nr:iron-containing alcohol dehydrogenase [Clostridium sp.]MDR3595367.1 iron-containing alcohol dehydrogenase [Clostridium sp.]
MLTDSLAIEAVRLVFKWLPKAYENGQDVEAREAMQCIYYCRMCI